MTGNENQEETKDSLSKRLVATPATDFYHNGTAYPIKAYRMDMRNPSELTVHPVTLIDTKTGKAGNRVTPGGELKNSIITAFGVSAAGLSLFVVPTGKEVIPLSLSTDVTCTATVGNRTIGIRIDDGTYIMWIGATSAATTAGQVCGYDIGFGNPLSTPSTTVRRNMANTGNVNIMVRENTSITRLAAGSRIIIDDYADVDIADSANWYLQYVELDA